MNTEPECYGKMFPSAIEIARNKPIAGKVFGYEVCYGGEVAQRRGATVNRDAWQECLKCDSLDGCYRLSTARILMELAVKSEPKTLY